MKQMVMMSKAVFYCVFAMIFVVATAAFGQGTSAGLTGQVTDIEGATVAGAQVSVRNINTNLIQSALTNAEGIYSIAPLPPGQYTVSVGRQGFEKYVQEGLILTVNQSATQNIALHPGSVQETIKVTANAELINTTSAELSTVVNEHAVTQLPLNGRDPSSLVFLAPGVTNVLNSNGALQAGFSFPSETGGSANGGRQGSTYYLLDGVPNMDNYLLLTAPFPNADATQEFRVITNNFDAHYGFAPGAVVSIETKGGGNSFHGGVFEFIRNQDLNASNWFSHTVDPLKRNQFGAYVGGPILRNKLFFFANYQGTRSSSASTANYVYTPTTAMLNGDFSGLASTPGVTNLNPAYGFATVGGKANQIDPSLLDKAAVAFDKAALPLGQATNGGVNYSGASTINKLDEFTGRLDYTISDNQRISLRSFIDHLTQPSGDIPGNMLSVLNLSPWSMVMGERMSYYNEAATHTWMINPRTVNVLSAFWTQMSAHSAAAVTDSSGKDLCLSNFINVNELPGQCYIEGFSVSGGFGSGWTEPSQELRTSYGLYDTLTKTIGNHTLSLGVNLQHQFAEEYTQYPTQPEISFNGGYTGSGLADFLLGDVSSFTQGAGEIADVAGWQPGFFGQDQYRLRPNLTLTAGLRWDPNLPPTSAGGRGAAFIPGETSTLYPNAPTGLVFPGDKGVTSGLMPTTYAYWEPRLGVAWQPRSLPHTSFRAGVGFFTAPLMYSMYNHTADISPFSPTYSFSGSPSNPISFDNPWASFSGTGGKSPFPPFTSVSTKPASNAAFATPVSIPAMFSNDFHLGITQSWNISVEQELGHNMAAHLAYVGSESYHQSTIIDQNPGIYANGGNRTTYSNFGEILTDFSNTTSSYHALQATVDKHFSHGFQFQSNFTWSKVIDVASSGNISFSSNQLPDPFDLRWNRGISALNVPLIWVSNMIYTTPGLAGRNELMKSVLGSWEVSAIVTSQSGSPFGISSGQNNNSGSQQWADRADVVPGKSFNVHQGSKSQWMAGYFNTSAFAYNAPGTFGDSGKNIFKGPAVNSTDLGLMKNWALMEGINLQFRCEMFNAFNHANMGTPGNTVGWGGFGQITSLGAIPPRVIQGALKLSF